MPLRNSDMDVCCCCTPVGVRSFISTHVYQTLVVHSFSTVLVATVNTNNTTNVDHDHNLHEGSGPHITIPWRQWLEGTMRLCATSEDL